MVYDNLKKKELSGDYKSYKGCSLINPKDPNDGFYVFVFFIADTEKSYTNQYITKRGE